MPGDLIIDLVRHMKAKNRRKWTGDDDERALSKLGLRQAEIHAGAMLEGNSIVAVYSSPALRCRQTVGPLAKRLGLSLLIEPLLAEIPRLLPVGAENPLLAKLRDAHPDGGRIVACSHADTIPAILYSLQVRPGFGIPAVLEGFGGWYRARIAGADVRIERFAAPPGFPKN